MSSFLKQSYLPHDELLPDPVIYEFSAYVKRMKQCKSRIDLFNSDDGKCIENELWDVIEASGVEVLSLDVFDTLLLRNNKSEARRYLELSQKILGNLQSDEPDSDKLKSLVAEDVCIARSVGMQTTYRTRPLVQGCGEGLIDEVVEVQRVLLGLSKTTKPLFLETEVDYEADNLTANPALSRIITRFRNKGGKIILISDMYMGSDMIGKIIKKVVDAPIYDYLFSSADLVISKRSGKVFPKIEGELVFSGKKAIHIGDSWLGDVERPREFGWNALYFPVSDHELHERQKDLEAFVNEMDEKGIETRSWAKI